MTINLAPFCGKDDQRAYLNEPFCVAGGTGACNGLILVWLDDKSSGKPLGAKEAESLERVIARAKAEAAQPEAQWVAVETIRTSSCKCTQCDGTGVVSVVDCEDCDGDGEFWHGNHQYDCKECDGAGHQNITGIGEQCEECGGTGKNEIGQPSAYGVTGADAFTVSSHFISRMRKLPGCRIKRYCSRPSGGRGLTFVFEGGVGIVMPLIKNPIEVEAQP